MSEEKELKGRVWAFVLYPDSCAYSYSQMLEKLNNLGVPMAISPLHIPDLNPVKMNESKNHFHCLMYFDGVKKESDLKLLTDNSKINCKNNFFNWDLMINKNHINKNTGLYPYFLKVNSISQYTRYLLHLDNPEKQQFTDYKINNIVYDDDLQYNTLVLLNGFNLRDYLTNTENNPDFTLIDIVTDNHINTIFDLMCYLRRNKNITLMNYIKKNNFWIKTSLLPFLYITPDIKQKK